MKIWLKRCRRTLCEANFNCIEMLALLVVLTLLFSFLIYVTTWAMNRQTELWQAIVTVPEPETCALCGDGDRPTYPAPCMVDLASGKVGALATKQARNNAPYHITVPENLEPMDPAHFCRDCRALLAAAATEGYVLLDLYAADTIQLYPVTPDTEYTIRDYTVSVTRSEASEWLEVLVTRNASET